MEKLNFNDRKVKVFFLILGLIAVLILYFAFFQGKMDGGKTAQEAGTLDTGILIDIPEAKTKEMEDSKLEAIRLGQRGKDPRRGDINDAWNELLGRKTDQVVKVDSIEGFALSDRPLSEEELLRKYYGDSYVSQEEIQKMQKESDALRGSVSRPRGGGGGGGGGVASVAKKSEPAVGSSVGSSTAAVAGTSVKEEPASGEAQEEERGVVHSMRSEMRRGGSATVSSRQRKETSSALVSSASPVRCQFVRDEVVASGERVSVRLLDPLVLDGTVIPANSRLSATVSVGDRIELSFSGYQMDGKIYRVNYSAYDNDGQKGLYCSATDEMARRAREQAVSDAASVASSVVGTVGGVVGRIASSAVNLGSTVTRGAGGSAKASIPSGYTFYILENS